MAADYTPVPPRTYPGVAAQTAAATRLVRTEAGLRQAITLYKQKPSSLSAIQLAADIKLTSTLTLDADTAGVRGLIIDGAGQYEISNEGVFSPMFDIRSDTKIRDTSITATGINTVFAITAGVVADVSGITITSSGDGYLFSLPGAQSQTTISNISVVDDGTSSGLITGSASTSSYWTLRDCKLFGLANVLDGGVSNTYVYDTIDNLISDITARPTGATLMAQLGVSSISNTQNLTPISTGAQTNNEFKHNLSLVANSTMTVGIGDLVFGAFGYSVPTAASSAFIGHSANIANGDTIVFGKGLAIGDQRDTANTVYEQTKLAGAVSTTNATQTTLFQYTPTNSNTGYYFEADIIGHQTNGSNQNNAYKICFKAKMNGSTLTGGTATTVYADEEVAGWDATMDISSTVVRVRITGAAATNIDWGAIVRIRRI